MTNEKNGTFAADDVEYRAKGMATIPVGNNKEPIGKGWNRLDIDDAEIQRRRTKHSKANIGLLLSTKIVSQHLASRPTVLAAVDVDEPCILAVVEAVLGPIVSAKIGQKGKTIFVQADAALKSSKILRKGSKKPVLELFISSGMTVLPPSWHPAGFRYQWVGKPLLETDPSELSLLDSAKSAILSTILESEDAWSILDGGENVQAHNAMLSLTSSGIANLTPDLEWLANCLGVLFHPDYKGNTKAEILGMLDSAKQKGLGSKPREPIIFNPGNDGPVPLGFTKDGNYTLLDRHRQIIIVASSGQLLSGQYLIGLAPSEFWFEQFPSKRGPNYTWAGEALIKACKLKGPFNPQRVRGRGIWREGNRVIINLGGSIDSGKYLYLCFEPIELDESASFDTVRLLALLQMFNWRHPQDAMLLLGWLALAPICGVLNWRPHCFVYGPARSGKTTIHTIAATLLKPLVIAADGQSSEAGIRQSLGPDSLPVMLDEFESDQNTRGLSQILRLARSASSADTPVLRGTPEGKAMMFSLRTAFFFAAINPRGMSPADQSRIVMLELLMHGNDSEKAKQILGEEAYFRSLDSAWCSYMVSMAAHIDSAIEALEAVILSADRRHRQNISTLLGAAFVALNGRVPDEEEAVALANEFKPSVDRHAEEIERDDALECLEYLFAHVVENYPLGHWLAIRYRDIQKNAKDQHDTIKILSMHDIILRIDGDTPGLLFRHGSPAIERIFQNTTWEKGAWQRALRKLTGSFRPTNPIQFPGSGTKARCVGVPLRYLPEPLPTESRKF